jgi:hypothetical protein
MRKLDNKPTNNISAFLFTQGGHEDPRRLQANREKSFNGSKVYGQGFTFDDTSLADDETPGIPSPISTMNRLVVKNPKNAEAIFPYIGGEEVNDSPTHAHHRFVIDFRDRTEEECRQEWPDLMRIIEKKVKSERTRTKPNGDYVLRTPLPQRWWQHGDKRPSLYAAITGSDMTLVNSQVSSQTGFSFIPSRTVFSHALNVFPRQGVGIFAAMESSVHVFWTQIQASSMKDDLRYTPSDCFETFPFPAALLDSTSNDPAHEATRQSLEAIGERYHQFRSELMVRHNEGLTSTYNRFHDPSESSSGLLQLRALRQEMDQAVLEAYGWSDALTQAITENPHQTPCGFGLDYLDLEDDFQLPEQLQERIDEGNLFFWDANDALDFQGHLRAAGAVKAKKRLPWRYRWPDSVRDDILARLLALNAERYEEEVAMGLHSKGAKKTAGAQRGRKPKSDPPTSPSSFQLEPEPLQMNFDLSGGR